MLKRVWKYNMKLNSMKCTFRLRADKFLGFYLTERGIEAIPDKCEVVVQMSAPTLKQEEQELNGMLTALNRFISKSSQHALPFNGLLRKKVKFEWTLECVKAFKSLKKVLAILHVITRPLHAAIVYLYLAV